MASTIRIRKTQAAQVVASYENFTSDFRHGEEVYMIGAQVEGEDEVEAEIFTYISASKFVERLDESDGAWEEIVHDFLGL